MKKKNIIIIGGGASGMMCAIKAKENNPDKSVVILEKQNRIGRKLLSTGNGRCNLCNINIKPENYSGSFAGKIKSLLELCSPERVVDEFRILGLLTKVEEGGRVYPITNQASTVLDVLRFALERLGVEVITDCKVEHIVRKNGKYHIHTENETFSADKAVITVGSCAAPKLGSEESAISLLGELGLKTKDFSPALCPLSVKSSILPSLKGVRASGKVSLYDGKKLIKEEKGEIQFTEKYLSGICVFNLSQYVAGCRKPIISLNLLPDYSDKEIYAILTNQKKLFADRNSEDFLTGILNKKLGTAVMKAVNLKLLRKVDTVSDEEITKIIMALTDWRFIVTETADFNSAQASSGGLVYKEGLMRPESYELTGMKGLYVCGEALDIVGDCGGFNLYHAFASGILTGENI